MEVPVSQRFIFIITFIAVLGFSLPAQSSTEFRLINDGKPVQVHTVDRPLDHHKERSVPEMQSSIASAKPGAVSKPEAAGPGFEIPLRRGVSNNNPGIYGISNFVDQDSAFPDKLLDWNCGDRTYDTATDNHNGTDYNSALFPWWTMDNDGLVVISVADGEIIDRHDGEFDRQCSFDPDARANFVVIEHDDGTITIYAHMKSGTVTTRKVGDRVEQGDYLGVVGSSGFSTGPHLHLGVQNRFNTLFDPYAGECNALNNESYWNDQEPYLVKGIASVDTHSASPEYPPCPQTEVPYFSDEFASQDTIYASVTVRDFDSEDVIDVELRNPAGQTVLETSFSDPEFGYAQAVSIIWGFQLGQPSVAGMYTWIATFGGDTRQHRFYVDASPPAPPGAKTANNAFTGLWYDPALDGEGFNIVTSNGGTIVYFYGSDNRGNRIWLISDPIPGEIKTGQTINVLMFESTGGVFSQPVPSARGLSAWGTLSLRFTACNSGQSALNGVDGYKESQITKLAGVSGAACVDGDVPADSGLAGLWYDPSKDGEGYNLIVSPAGRTLYFYGFSDSGLRLWLISALITEPLEVGNTAEVILYRATQGTFSNPVPSSQALEVWGTARITVIDCSTVTIVMEGTDGGKTSSTVRLAGIIGVGCSN